MKRSSEKDAEATINDLFTHQEPSEAPPPYSSVAGRTVPPFLSLYEHKERLSSSVYQLGSHQSQPLFIVVFAGEWRLKSSIELYRDADYASIRSSKKDPWAIVEDASILSSKSNIKLPESGASHPLSHKPGLKTETWSFVTDVADSNNDHAPWPEKFEWRVSHAKEVRDLDQSRWGWKLVRLGRGVSAPEVHEQGHREAGVSSDGKEVVAVWVQHGGWSMKKVATLKLLGSGASGELGEDWAVLAVASFLRVYRSEVEGD